MRRQTARHFFVIRIIILINDVLSYTQSAQKKRPHAVLKKSSTHAGFCVVDVGGLTGVVPTPPARGKPPRRSSLKI
jgi:hypothetical protein